MANAKQCDICKSFYPAHKMSRRARGWDCRDSAAILLFDPDPEATNPEDMDDGKMEFETCPACMKRIKDFIELIR